MAENNATEAQEPIKKAKAYKKLPLKHLKSAARQQERQQRQK